MVDVKTKISVVVLNYNGLKYLKETLPAIFELEYSNKEIIVVDNGSTDGSLEYLKKSHGLNLLNSPKEREKNFACNFAIEHAKGEYVLLLDNDILIVQKDLLEVLLKRYVTNRKTGAIGLAYYNRGEELTRGYGAPLGYYFIKEVKPLPLNIVKGFDRRRIAFPAGIGFFIKKSIWEEVGGYEDFLKFGGDDNDLGIKLCLRGYENYLYAKTLQVHLGMSERQDNEKYALKWREMFFAHLFTVFKNYGFLNMVFAMLGLSIFGLLKTLKQSIQRRHFGTLLSYFGGYYLFFKNLPVALAKRRIIQETRTVKRDVFLNM